MLCLIFRRVFDEVGAWYGMGLKKMEKWTGMEKCQWV